MNSHTTEPLLRAILDTVVDCIITIDVSGTIRTVNPAAERIFLYSAEEMVGRNVNLLMPAPYAEQHDTYLQNYLNTGENKIIGIGREVTGKRKDGSTFPLELAVSEMQIGDEQLFTGIVRDISERKQAEMELRDSASRIRAIVDTVVDGIVTIDSKGCIQTFNRAAETIFGYELEEVKGKNVSLLMPEPYQSEHDGYLHNYLSTGNKKIIGIGREVSGRHKNGSTFPMELAVSEMEINGERMFTGIVRDITERKRLDKMKTEFVSTVSHELRTPLTSIRGALNLVLGNLGDELAAKPKRMLEMAERNSERLTLLINDILDLEKIESGSMEFDFKQLDLRAVARQALEDNDGYAKKHDVSLELELPEDDMPVRGDEHRLLQVFANLMSNAIKYSPSNGKVMVSVNRTDSRVRVAVQDRGAGVPEELHGRIFDRFSQADSSDTREKGGTGLGLSIAKAIVDYHDGNIGFDTGSDGTCFYFDLPFISTYIKSSTESSSGERALICEDNVEIAEVLVNILQGEGIEADIATTVENARSAIKEQNYCVLLLDLILPDESGLNLIQELRKNPETRDLPIIVVSAIAEEGKTAINGDAITVADWIQKPFDNKHLLNILHDTMPSLSRPTILHIEDDPDIVQIVQVLLQDEADCLYATTVKEARQYLKKGGIDLVLLDLELADGSGVSLLEEIRSCCPVIIFSAQEASRNLAEQVNAALTKSRTSNARLLQTIRKVLSDSRGEDSGDD